MKCDIISARRFGVGPLRISWIVQKLVWLNRLVNATMFGATVYLFFLFHEQLVNSSGWISANAGKSNSVIWPANSSAGMRNALNTTASTSLIDEFVGKLCVLLDGGVPQSAFTASPLVSSVIVGWWFISGKMPVAELLRRRLFASIWLFVAFLSQCLRKWPLGVLGTVGCDASFNGVSFIAGDLDVLPDIRGMAWPEPRLRPDTSLSGDSSRKLR